MQQHAYKEKRFDRSTNLFYFGKRYYSPILRQWISPDPLYNVDHSNLYQYVYNNPHLFDDPTGEFVVGAPLIYWGVNGIGFYSVSAIGTSLFQGMVVGAISYGGYKGACYLNDYLKSRETLPKKGSIDPSLPSNPDDLLEDKNWEETTHPEAGKNGHRKFENKETGEELHHDEAKPGQSGHGGHPHYHRPNPESTGNHDKYLDGAGNTVGNKSDPSRVCCVTP